MELGVIHLTALGENMIDFGCFCHRGMILPEVEHGVGVVPELVQKRQGYPLPVHRARGGTGGIHGDSFDMLAGVSTCFLKCPAHAEFQGF